MSALKLLFGTLSPQGPRARLSILIFHRVRPQPDPLLPSEPDAVFFENILQWVKAWFNILPLDEAVVRLKRGALPARALSITFDDGYEDNVSVALPLLKKYGCPACFFIATGYLDGGVMWNDRVIDALRAAPGDVIDLSRAGLGVLPIGSLAQRRAAIDRVLSRLKYLDQAAREEAACHVSEAASVVARTLMMRSDQVRAVHAAGMQIGAHTVTHPILSRIDARAARREIATGREQLEALTSERVSLFAYPNGRPGTDYGDEHVRLVRALGFDAAVSTLRGVARGGGDCYQLPRFTPWDRTRTRYGLRLAQTLIQFGSEGGFEYA